MTKLESKIETKNRLNIQQARILLNVQTDPAQETNTRCFITFLL